MLPPRVKPVGLYDEFPNLIHVNTHFHLGGEHTGEELNEFNEGLPWWLKKKIIDKKRRESHPAPAPPPPPGPPKYPCSTAEPQSPRNVSDGFMGMLHPRVKPVGLYDEFPNLIDVKTHFHLGGEHQNKDAGGYSFNCTDALNKSADCLKAQRLSLACSIQKGVMFDMRDASVAGCTLEEDIHFPLLWEQPVLQSRGKLLSCFRPLDGHRSWILQAKKTQDSEFSPRPCRSGGPLGEVSKEAHTGKDYKPGCPRLWAVLVARDEVCRLFEGSG
eukprot:s5557_g1.t1